MMKRFSNGQTEMKGTPVSDRSWWEKPFLWLLPNYAAAMLLIMLAYNFLIYYGSKLLLRGFDGYHCLQLPFEKKIPLVPWTVWVYVSCFLFWAVNYVLSMRMGKKASLRFAAADIIGKTVCLFFFLALPSTLQRPEITGNSWSEQMLRFVYQVDAANNLFPSLHCMVSWLCFIGIRKNPRIPGGYKIFSCLFAAAVCAATLTVKQHVLADAAAGVALAEGCYYLAGRIISKTDL